MVSDGSTRFYFLQGPRHIRNSKIFELDMNITEIQKYSDTRTIGIAINNKTILWNA